jgi:hypothetical protein
MQRGIPKRIESLALPPSQLSANSFIARAIFQALRRRTSLRVSFLWMASKLSDEDLESLCREFELIAFGDDPIARDAAKRSILAALDYPVWTLPDEWGFERL